MHCHTCTMYLSTVVPITLPRTRYILEMKSMIYKQKIIISICCCLLTGSARGCSWWPKFLLYLFQVKPRFLWRISYAWMDGHDGFGFDDQTVSGPSKNPQSLPFKPHESYRSEQFSKLPSSTGTSQLMHDLIITS